MKQVSGPRLKSYQILFSFWLHIYISFFFSDSVSLSLNHDWKFSLYAHSPTPNDGPYPLMVPCFKSMDCISQNSFSNCLKYFTRRKRNVLNFPSTSYIYILAAILDAVFSPGPLRFRKSGFLKPISHWKQILMHKMIKMPSKMRSVRHVIKVYPLFEVFKRHFLIFLEFIKIQCRYVCDRSLDGKKLLDIWIRMNCLLAFFVTKYNGKASLQLHVHSSIGFFPFKNS